MAYRDEHHALLARLAATEERLRVVEHELAEARRRLHGEALVGPSAPPPGSRRVGYRPTRPAYAAHGPTAAAVLGVVLALFGVAFLLWSFPGEEELGEMLTTLGIAFGVGLAPGGVLVHYALRAPVRAQPAARVTPRRVPPRRVEVPLVRAPEPRARVADETAAAPEAHEVLAAENESEDPGVRQAAARD
ncbi:MAG: hypothetical protein JWP97_4275 [Labilithrix sp.]|nr:hypothetical protein [Labilithrix sp.]